MKWMSPRPTLRSILSSDTTRELILLFNRVDLEIAALQRKDKGKFQGPFKSFGKEFGILYPDGDSKRAIIFACNSLLNLKVTVMLHIRALNNTYTMEQGNKCTSIKYG